MGWELVEIFEYDLVLLDLHLPKMDGIAFCRQLRAGGHDVPVLLMTAEDTRASKIAGLDAGADDYVIKPLDLDELSARIRALLRRGRSETAPVLTWGDVSINPSSCEVFCQEHRLHLTSKQYELLELFLRYPHRIFSISALIERLWSLDKIPSENAIRTHIKSLRHKLKQNGAEDIIETVYGLGYRLKAESDNPTPNPQIPTDAGSDILTIPVPDVPAGIANPAALTNNHDPLMASSREIWERHQHKYLDLIAALAQVVPALQSGNLSTASSLAENQLLLERSRKQAHTLKGALGCFGFMAASQIATRIEHILSNTPWPKREQLYQLPSNCKFKI